MTFYLKLAAYTFLALMGFSAWRAGVEGWRYYFAIVLFFFCVLRILTILRQRVNRRDHKSSAGDTQPGQTGSAADKTDPPCSSDS